PRSSLNVEPSTTTTSGISRRVNRNGAMDAPPPASIALQVQCVRRPVGFAQHPLPPAAVVEVPLHRRRQSCLEAVTRLPPQLPVQLVDVHRVAAIVTGAIRDVADQGLGPVEDC